jgi:hypothetical protein
LAHIQTTARREGDCYIGAIDVCRVIAETTYSSQSTERRSSLQAADTRIGSPLQVSAGAPTRSEQHAFCLTVRTGPEDGGMDGISLLLIDRDLPGVTVRRMKTQGWWMSYTAYITFENVRVPVSNLIGNEHEGFMPIMTNFNLERFAGVIMCVRFARVCLVIHASLCQTLTRLPQEDSIKYARQRRTFGKKLKDHQV